MQTIEKLNEVIKDFQVREKKLQGADSFMIYAFLPSAKTRLY